MGDIVTPITNLINKKSKTMEKEKTTPISKNNELALKIIDVLKGKDFHTSEKVLKMALSILSRRSIVT